VLVASIFGWVLWFVVYGVFELQVDPGRATRKRVAMMSHRVTLPNPERAKSVQ
jgi:hypothetical protein